MFQEVVRQVGREYNTHCQPSINALPSKSWSIFLAFLGNDVHRRTHQGTCGDEQGEFETKGRCTRCGEARICDPARSGVKSGLKFEPVHTLLSKRCRDQSGRHLTRQGVQPGKCLNKKAFGRIQPSLSCLTSNQHDLAPNSITRGAERPHPHNDGSCLKA